MSRSLPLEGLVVADFTRVLAGPYCTLLLADLGAEIIKIERTGTGDDTRAWGPPFVDGDSAYFLGLNRGKKSVAVDFGVGSDRDLAFRIATGADVVIENFTDGVMQRFDLDYARIRQANPAVIYCTISAYASQPTVPGYDLLMQAASGFMSVTGPEGGPPTKVGVAVLDVLAGLHACVGILAALDERRSSGQGNHVRVGLFESSVAALVNQASNYLLAGQVPRPSGNQHPSIVPYQTFEAADGPIVVAAGNDRLFAGLCAAIDRLDLLADPRFLTNASRVANRVELVEDLEAVFKGATVDHWVSRLVARDVPASPIRNLHDVFTSPEGRATLVPVETRNGELVMMVRSPIMMERGGGPVQHQRPPSLGEHTGVIRERFPD